VSRVIPHPKLLLNEGGHPWVGSHLPPEPEGFGTPSQQLRQLGPLFRRQPGVGAGDGTAAQRHDAAFFPSPLKPLAHRTGGDAQGGSDILLLPPGLVEFIGTEAAAFAPTDDLVNEGLVHAFSLS
jgi:hypothetical protein